MMAEGRKEEDQVKNEREREETRCDREREGKRLVVKNVGTREESKRFAKGCLI
jgi:hypothetical protein